MRDCDKQMLADHYLDFYRMAYSMLHNETDSEDAVQEALAQTMARPLLTKPYRYCVRTLYNRCYRMMKRKPFVLPDRLPDLATESENPNETRIQRLMKLKETLPQRTNQALDMYYRDGLTFDQISEQIGVSRSMIQKMVHNAEQHLREQIIELEIKEVFETK